MKSGAVGVDGEAADVEALLTLVFLLLPMETLLSRQFATTCEDLDAIQRESLVFFRGAAEALGWRSEFHCFTATLAGQTSCGVY